MPWGFMASTAAGEKVEAARRGAKVEVVRGLEADLRALRANMMRGGGEKLCRIRCSCSCSRRSDPLSSFVCAFQSFKSPSLASSHTRPRSPAKTGRACLPYRSYRSYRLSAVFTYKHPLANDGDDGNVFLNRTSY